METSTDWDRFVDAGVLLAVAVLSVLAAEDVAAEVDEAQCCERMERDSSIGVKILRDFTESFLTGSSICWGCCCCCGCGCGSGS